ncbi:MAG TPA: amylo-alpha-1,6-glucosidase, partial [Bacteroidota bacterium]
MVALPSHPSAVASAPASTLDSLGIRSRGSSRPFCYTNKAGAFFYGESNGANTPGWEGFTVEGHNYLGDYTLEIDGAPLDRGKSVATVFPDFLRREYPGGIVEELRPADSIAALVITIVSPQPVEVKVLPFLAGGRTGADFETIAGESSVTIARRNHMRRTAAENYPVWLSLCAPGCAPSVLTAARAAAFSPGSLVGTRRKTQTIAVATGDTREESLRLARYAAGARITLAQNRRSRMESLLSSTATRTSDNRFDRGLAWAKLSLDALTVSGGGIYAGLPWFADYWGRDTFIALPGEALVTGHFAEARRILELFALFQQRDSLSTDYGRIPNRVTATDTAYNTADGTPRFVMIAREYAERSGDKRFAFNIYPVILRSIEGTIRYHTDSLGFLTHGDAETWMDAVGPDGPWSPRGNRANDIQALWGAQLESGEYFATLVGDVTSARRWHEFLLRLKGNFRRYFVTTTEIADRLRPDGTADMTLRPNQIFTARLLDDARRARMLDTVVSRLTYEYGVASLSQDDPGFHPWHEYPPFYPKDAAYHNGTVWTWLQGPLISLLCAEGGEETAWKITANSVHQILDRGAAGTQSELLDAIPRPGEKEPRLSGTFSQAWNLAEFIRNFYDDYLGVRFNRLTRSLSLEPKLPPALGSVSTRINAGSEAIGIAVTRTSGPDAIGISSAETADTIRVHALVHISGKTYFAAETMLPPRSVLRIMYAGGTLRATRNGADWPARVTGTLFPGRLSDGLRLAHPQLREGLEALRGPGYPLLPHDLIMRRPAASPVVDAHHLANPAYTYPRNPAFVPGSFALRRFTMSLDSSYAYFTLAFAALSDPGWHPEYGFQLTFAAIAIDEDGIPGSGGRIIGKNASVILEERHCYEKIIYVGGGIQIEDAHGTVLAAYIPVKEDALKPFGDAASGTIRFALPLSLLGRPTDGWTYTVVAGGQDDHGGSGLGEFRTVNRDQGEWNGGGKLLP